RGPPDRAGRCRAALDDALDRRRQTARPRRFRGIAAALSILGVPSVAYTRQTAHQDWVTAASGAGYLAPGERFVDSGFAGEPEDALAEDVAHDLGGAALDRVGPRPQEHVPRLAERGGEA